MAKKRTYKVLGHDGEPCHGGSGRWDLDGGWMPRIEDIVPCGRGYHLCDGDPQLLPWLGPEIWVAEWRGDRIDHGDKIVVSEARLVRRLDTWNDRTARLFACDCAENVLHIFEVARPCDDRPRRAIETARRYAYGEATADELAAAGNAAWNAARDSGAAAGNAAGNAAWNAAGNAAWNAAMDARDAARAAAWAAEKRWQAERLRQYLDGEAP